MFGRLFILFTLVPLLELYLLIKVGSHLGAEATILLIVLTGGVGALMARMLLPASLSRGENAAMAISSGTRWAAAA